jgi:hypothetical protein
VDLNGRRILFIGIGFYDYDVLIVKKLTDCGAHVTYVCQEHENYFINQLTRSKFLSGLESIYSVKYLTDTLSDKSNYDEVFVIKGSRLTTDIITMLRRKNPNAIFRLYQWDSIKRFEGDKAIFDLFDHVYSFDRIDCLNHAFTFIPLFFRKTIERKLSYTYDVSFVGWLHFERLKLLENMSSDLLKVDRTYKFYLFTSIKNWLLLNVLKNVKFIHRKSLRYDEYTRIISDSDAILDFHHPEQNGLTMRTIEALGANRKIITTNSDVKNYDFYKYNNVLILDNNTKRVDIIDFLSRSFSEVPIDIINKYSLDCWLSRIFR